MVKPGSAAALAGLAASALFVTACVPTVRTAPGLPSPSASARADPVPDDQHEPDEGAARDPRIAMHPCTDGAIDAPEVYDAPSAVRLTYDNAWGAFEGDPVTLPDDLVRTVDGAVVAVRGPGDRSGSGFVVDAGGRAVVLTAAHVTRDALFEGLRVVDVAGREVGVTGGCYAYQVFSTPVGLDHDAAFTAVDVAVLIPDGPIGTSALEIGERAAPGEWVLLDNFQTPFDPTYGRNLYTAVAVSGLSPTDRGYSVLTGVGTIQQPDDRHAPVGPGVPEAAEYTSTPGSSGGLVADLTGRVVGMSVRVSDETETQLDLDLSGITIDGVEIGAPSGVLPRVTGIVPPDVLGDVVATALTDPATAAALSSTG